MPTLQTELSTYSRTSHRNKLAKVPLLHDYSNNKDKDNVRPPNYETFNTFDQEHRRISTDADNSSADTTTKCCRSGNWIRLALLVVVILLFLTFFGGIALYYFSYNIDDDTTTPLAVDDDTNSSSVDVLLRDYSNYSSGSCDQYKCGRYAAQSPPNKKNNMLRIIGGDSARPYSWPWQVALMRKSPTGFFLTCGASLITNRWVMTAAHCFQTDRNPDNYLLKMGVYNKNSLDEPGELIVPVMAIYVHPNFIQQQMYNDIALIQLPYSIQCNDHVTPICLPNQGDPLPKMGQMLTVTGWGTTLEGSSVTSATLQQVQVPIIVEPLCKLAYPFIINYEYSFCAGYKSGGKDACQGDSGGPAVYRNSQENQDSPWVQVGITSWGDGCAQSYRPGVYTRVSSYIHWIETFTNVQHAL